MAAAREIDTTEASDFNWRGVHARLQDRVPSLEGALRVFQFPGGFSNLTYLVSVGESDFVLKRPPAGPRPKGAHDMKREYQMLSGLRGAFRFAPAAIDFCDDLGVAGSEYLIMERVNGVVIRPDEIARLGLTTAERREQLLELVSAMAALHAVDHEKALPGNGRPEGYRERQVSGWIGRMEKAATPGMPDFAGIASWLTASMPRTAAAASVVHNDFKLDNLVWREDAITSLRAVLDWEMATVGNPLMDLAVTLSFWIERGDPEEFRALRAMPSDFEGAPSRKDAIARYEEKTGAKLTDFPFYLAFAMFRRAVIEQQKFARFHAGHTTDARYANLDAAVSTLLDMARLMSRG